MQLTHAEWVWTEHRETVTAGELCAVCGLSTAELDELVDYGAIAPLASAGPAERSFTADCVVPLRTAGKLRLDFDLDLFTMSLLLGYLRRIDALEHEVRSLRAHLPAHAHPPGRHEGPGVWKEPHP